MNDWTPDRALTFLYQLVGEGTHKLPPCSRSDASSSPAPWATALMCRALEQVSEDRRGGRRHRHRAPAPAQPASCRGGRAAGCVLRLPRYHYCMDRYVPWCHDVCPPTPARWVITALSPSCRPGGLRRGAGVRPHGHDARAARSALPIMDPCLCSLEKKMACGIGACLGCTCETKSGEAERVQERPGL